MSELKPCPFCGGKAIVRDCNSGDYVAQCKKCYVETTEYPSKYEAVKSWNRRAKQNSINPVIFTERTNAGIELTVRKGTDGQDMLHTALMLLKMIFGGATGLEPVEDLDSAFNSVKAMYMAEHAEEAPCKT